MSNETSTTHVVKVSLSGGTEQEILTEGPARPVLSGGPGSISRDGRMLLSLASPDSWFSSPESSIWRLAASRGFRPISKATITGCGGIRTAGLSVELSLCGLPSGSSLQRSGSGYFTASETPCWLRRAEIIGPIETVIGIAAPVRTVGGTMALICTSPATAPGAVPA